MGKCEEILQFVMKPVLNDIFLIVDKGLWDIYVLQVQQRLNFQMKNELMLFHIY